MVLVHKGTELTGTVGPSADTGPPRATITLTYADGHLKGDIILERGGLKLTGQVDVTRVK